MRTKDQTTVRSLALQLFANNPDFGSKTAAEVALRSHFDLAEGDGIWGGSEAACAMGFKGHGEDQNLITAIIDAVADELANPEAESMGQESEDGTKLAYRMSVTGGGDLDNCPSVAVFSIDKATAELILRISGIVKANDLHKAEKFDYRANFMQYDPETDPEDAADAGDENSVRTECDALVIKDDSFFYAAYVKHTDVKVETESCPISELVAHFGLAQATGA